MIILSKVKVSEENGSVLYFYKSLQCRGLIEDSWIPSPSAPNPLQCVILGEVYKENLASEREVLGERVF